MIVPERSPELDPMTIVRWLLTTHRCEDPLYMRLV
jgi:hypothetical protein